VQNKTITQDQNGLQNHIDHFIWQTGVINRECELDEK
jgi:hypothetical protein